MTINRRTLLQLAPLLLAPAARALAAGQTTASGTSTSGRRPRVIVIGAGILGAAIGFELARRGAEVTILERGQPGMGVTRDSFAYLNASTKVSDATYFHLNWLGLTGWHLWQQETGATLPLSWGGSVYWRNDTEGFTRLQQTLQQAQALGYDGKALGTQDLRLLAPQARIADGARGTFFPGEGAIDPVEAVVALLARARAAGAKLVHPVDVTALRVANGRVTGVQTADDTLEADHVVLAAGHGSRALAEQAGVKLPVGAETAILMHSKPAPRLTDRVLFSPAGSVRQTRDGRFVAGARVTPDDTQSSKGRQAIGEAIRDKVATVLPAIAESAIDRVSIGQRVMPADRLPIVGFVPEVAGLYAVSTHSGMTLAPVIARLAAVEILDGVATVPLAPYRPARFA